MIMFVLHYSFVISKGGRGCQADEDSDFLDGFEKTLFTK